MVAPSVRTTAARRPGASRAIAPAGRTRCGVTPFERLGAISPMTLFVVSGALESARSPDTAELQHMACGARTHGPVAELPRELAEGVALGVARARVVEQLERFGRDAIGRRAPLIELGDDRPAEHDVD